MAEAAVDMVEATTPMEEVAKDMVEAATLEVADINQVEAAIPAVAAMEE